MLTHETYVANMTHAPTITRDSAAIAGLRPWLYEAQGGKCWDCGKAMEGYADGSGIEICHIIGGMGSNGICEGNVALGHRVCNMREVMAFNTVIPWAYVAPRAFRIPTEWPTRKELVSMGREDKTLARMADADAVANMLAECDV